MTTYVTSLLRTDRRVLEMADRNHQPAELTVRSAGTGLASNHVVCDQCGEDWPCAIRAEVDRIKPELLREALDDITNRRGKP